jgi:TRAP transporter TAXI family solute receptor
MKFFHLFCFVSALFLSGCRPGLTNSEMQQELQKSLDTNFSAGLFEVQYLKRQGSQPIATDTGEKAVVVYFKAVIKFCRDYNLSAWEKLNSEALATLLGSAPQGITGIKETGNKTGDLLRIFGTATHRKKDGKWLAANIIKKAPEKKSTADNTPGNEALDKISSLQKTYRNRRQQTEARIIEQELDSALLRISLKLDQIENRISLISGGTSGRYFAFGNDIEKLYGGQNHLRNYATAGSVENCLLIGNELADFAIAQNDTAYMSYYSEGLFAGERPLKNLRAIASLYPEAVQIIVGKNSNINSLSELQEQKIALGPKGSGSAINARQLFSAAGLNPDKLKTTNLSVSQGINEFIAGNFDVLVTTNAYPLSALSKAASQRSIKLLPLSAGLIEKMQQKHPFYIPLRIPKNIYPGVDKDVETIGVTALLLTHQNTKIEKVQKILELLYKAPKTVTLLHAGRISLNSASIGISIPRHVAAKEFFSSIRMNETD